MEEKGIAALEVRLDVEAAWDEEVQQKLSRSVWNTGGCVSWYLDEQGRNPTLWPDFTFRFARRVRHFDLESYYQQLRPTESPGSDRRGAVATAASAGSGQRESSG